MATPTYAQLIAAYPELTTSDSDEQTTIGTLLAHAERLVSSDQLATAATIEAMRLALGAHLTKLLVHRNQKHGGGGVGPVSGRLLSGGTQVTYGQIQMLARDSHLGSTAYGLIYKDLRRCVFVGGVVG